MSKWLWNIFKGVIMGLFWLTLFVWGMVTQRYLDFAEMKNRERRVVSVVQQVKPNYDMYKDLKENRDKQDELFRKFKEEVNKHLDSMLMKTKEGLEKIEAKYNEDRNELEQKDKEIFELELDQMKNRVISRITE
jgi:biopolymer transport protein ExbB/TolQ